MLDFGALPVDAVAEASTSASSAKDCDAAISNLVDVAANNVVTVEMLRDTRAIADNASVAAQDTASRVPLEGAGVLPGIAKVASEEADASAGPSASLLVGVELSEVLREDGRLLRMFVARGEHLKSEARQLAVRSWLIPGEFYDKWFEVFVARYAHKYAEAADLKDRSSEVAAACLPALACKANVDALEAKLRTSGKDVFQLRDLLLTAAKDLTKPRRHLGVRSDIVMPPEAIEALRLQRQVRLRTVVLACLRGIYASGVGGEVLRIASESAKSMIERFEDAEDEVCTARQGGQWHELKVLLDEIEEASGRKALADGTSGEPVPPITDSPDAAEVRKIKQTKREGKGTKFLVEKALTDLGGEATTRELMNWVEEHQEFTEEHSSMRINKKLCAPSQRHSEVPIWHRTLQAVLSCHFTGVRRNGKGFVWRSPNSVPALTADADGDESALPALPPASALDAAAEQASHTLGIRKPRQRKRKSTLQAADVASGAAPGEDAAPKAASAPGRGKRKSARGQKDQAAPTLDPDPLALLSALDVPETPAIAPSQAEEPRAKRATPRSRSAATAEDGKEAGGDPSLKRARKAKLDIDVDPLSLALDAAIAAASTS